MKLMSSLVMIMSLLALPVVAEAKIAGIAAEINHMQGVTNQTIVAKKGVVKEAVAKDKAVNETSKATKAKSTSSKVNINTANVEQLQQLKGVGEKKAQAIVAYRKQHGNFKSIDQLAEVKGIGPKLLQKNKGALTLK
ncbi:ComEA family DNA-binding protein [Shewanella marina]|uniref:ComEA family DNA-binding protein n=1 Tax=Shewanella marina TaxID=487319 RepID=UPI00046F1BDF|nr:helix-hairpin-helix domain-containing protein [Shewanella marina]